MSPGWVVVICIVGMLLAPVIAILISVGLGYVFRYERCPRCGKRKLRTAQFYRATVLVNGKRAPDAWGYYECEACGVRLKQRVNHTEFTQPSAEEWEREVLGHDVTGRP